MVPVGINVVDGKRIDEGTLEEEILVIQREETTVNVNKLDDLKIAERLRAPAET